MTIVIVGRTPIATGVAAALRAGGGTVTELDDDDFTSEAATGDALPDRADLLVHAAVPPTLLREAAFAELDDQRWIDGCERGLEVAWWVARQAIPMLRPTRGSMVFLVPTLGMAGGAGFTMLATWAEGVRVLAKGCGRQLAGQGVRVNTIATAPHLWVEADDAEQLTRSITLSTPAFGRPGEAADVAAVVRALGSDDMHFVTAATLTADGGTWMGL